MSRRILTSAAVTMLITAPIGAQQSRDFKPYLMADRAAEVRLARSAAPENVSESATVLALISTGYVEAARGTGGFTCLVLRSFSGSVDDPDYWNPRVRSPACFNKPASQTVVVEVRKVAGWVLSGASQKEIATRLQRAYASHDIPLPGVGAMAYMLSPQQYLTDANPHWVPHLMFFYDKAKTSGIWGAGGAKPVVIDGSSGDAHGSVETLLVPVTRWSDGTSAPASGAH